MLNAEHGGIGWAFQHHDRRKADRLQSISLCWVRMLRRSILQDHLEGRLYTHDRTVNYGWWLMITRKSEVSMIKRCSFWKYGIIKDWYGHCRMSVPIWQEWTDGSTTRRIYSLDVKSLLEFPVFIRQIQLLLIITPSQDHRFQELVWHEIWHHHYLHLEQCDTKYSTDPSFRSLSLLKCTFVTWSQTDSRVLLTSLWM